jgi:hypothetical protein
MEGKNYFNEPKVDLNDLSLFPAEIYERTKKIQILGFQFNVRRTPNRWMTMRSAWLKK